MPYSGLVEAVDGQGDPANQISYSGPQEIMGISIFSALVLLDMRSVEECGWVLFDNPVWVCLWAVVCMCWYVGVTVAGWLTPQTSISGLWVQAQWEDVTFQLSISYWAQVDPHPASCELFAQVPAETACAVVSSVTRCVSLLDTANMFSFVFFGVVNLFMQGVIILWMVVHNIFTGCLSRILLSQNLFLFYFIVTRCIQCALLMATSTLKLTLTTCH